MKNNKWWFSVLVSILIIGFLMILTVWTFNIVLWELNDSKWNYDYLKSSYAAEAAWELALLKIKNKWYWYYDKIDSTVNDRSVVLSNNSTDKTKFRSSKDALIYYDLNSKTNSYEWNLSKAWWVDIIPLFYEDKTWVHKTIKLKLKINYWNETKLAWNIIWKKFWIWWVWEFDSEDLNSKWIWRFKDNLWNLVVLDKQIKDFLLHSDNNYLILKNVDSWSDIKYKLSWDYFTLPRINILATWKVWKYKQNLNIFLDNTDYLGRTRYSIYSN